jgi:hypothetical protein
VEAPVQRRRKKAKVMTVLILAARVRKKARVMTVPILAARASPSLRNLKALRNLKVRKKARVMTVPILAARASQSLEVMTTKQKLLLLLLHPKVRLLMRPNAKFLRGHWKSIFQILGVEQIASHQVI